MTIHFNQLMLVGLCLIPGAFIAFFATIGILGKWFEWGALAIAGVTFWVMICLGVILLLIGIGMGIG